MLQFAWPYVFAALPLPVLVAVFAKAAHQRPNAALRVPFFSAFQQSTPVNLRPSRWRFWLSALAWVLLIVAASRPQWLGEPLQLPASGRDLLLAVDISGSMEIGDMLLNGRPATRLSAVKTLASDFIRQRTGDRIGLVLFGARAYIQTPLTFDRETVRTLLNEAEIGLAGKETAIGDAIGLAVKRLRERPQQNRVMILLTDGANTAGEVEPLQAAEIAAQEGLRIYTIGVGADEMLMRDPLGARLINPSIDLDETTLRAIATVTGGRYFRARDATALKSIYQLLDKLEPVASDQQSFRPVQELYPWPLVMALVITIGFAMANLDWRQREVH